MSAPATYPVGTIAKLFNLTERRVQQLAAEGVIPKAAHGRYELVPAVQGYVKYLQERSLGQQLPEGQIDYHAEKARKTRAEADIAEMDAAARRGELVEAAAVGATWATVFREVQANLLGQAPARIASLVIGEREEGRIKSIVLAEMREALDAAASTDAGALLGGSVDGGDPGAGSDGA